MGDWQEKRRQKRYSIQVPASLILPDKNVPVRILDINTRGASFVLPPFEEVPTHFQLGMEHGSKTVIFKCETKDQTTIKAKNGVSLIRIGLFFLESPSEAMELFGNLSRNVDREDAPTQRLPSPDGEDAMTQKLPDPEDSELSGDSTALQFADASEFPTQQMDVQPTDARGKKRAPIQLPIILVNQGVKFQGRSIDITESGLGLLTTLDFPATENITLHCKAREGLVFRLQVQERFRKTIKMDGKEFLKLGTKIMLASPEFQKFLEESHITQHETQGYSSHDHRHAETGHVLKSCKYRYIDHLGTGGFAKVFLVEDVALHRKVAMKILLPNITEDKSMAKKFIKEAQIAAKFHHPNIALVYEVGEIFPEQFHEFLEFPDAIKQEFKKGMVYFTMQYIEGRTLADVIKKQKKLPPLQVLGIMRNVGKALEFAHQKGVVHRDIKPENIMMTFNDKILVTDFGIASVLKQSRTGDGTGFGLDSGETQSKTKGFMGTPLYVSPEQILEAEIDGRTDLYSLGITGYELLTGVPPFKGKTWMETLAKQLHEPPVPLQDIDPTVPANFNDFILRLIQKKKEDRPSDAKSFLKRLDRLEEFLMADRVVIDKMEEVSEEAFESIEKLFKQFTKAMKTIGTYPESHEMVQSAIARLFTMFESAFEDFERLDFEISSMHVDFHGRPVFSEDQKENGFCFNLFRDGVRNLIFFRGLPQEELRDFMITIFNYINNTKTFEIDSVTLLFQLALKYIDFEYADSFYEDPESQTRMFKIQKTLFKEEKWSVPQMLQSAFPSEKLIVYWKNIQTAYKTAHTELFTQRLRNPDLSIIRHEAIRICLLLAENEQKTEVFDDHYALMEEVIYSCVAENDLSSALYVLKSLEAWALNAPENDLRNCAGRFVSLQERLSTKDFLEPLVDKFFYISRTYGDGIQAICESLLADSAVPVLFEFFSNQDEDWKQSFLAKCAVLAAGPNTGRLNQLALTLVDNKASIFIRAYRLLHPKAPKTTLMKWLTYPGLETRLALVRLADQLNRAESLPILKRCASEKSGRFEASRNLAWKILEKNHPKSLQTVASDFLTLQALKDLSNFEKNQIFKYASSVLAQQGGEDFLIELVQEKGMLGTTSIPIEDKKRAAEYLVLLNSPRGNEVLIKESKRLLGNRDFIHYLKRLCEKIQ